MTQNGQPDTSRSSRYILKDYVNGRILYCHAPPGVPQNDYHKFGPRKRIAPPPISRKAEIALKPVNITPEGLDKQFFNQVKLGYHVKGSIAVTHSNITGDRSINASSLSLSSSNVNDKPWKNHKEKRNKKEKLRRVYRHLDE